MKEEFDRIHKKLDTMDDTLIDIQADLRYHIKRTDLVEKRLDKHELQLQPLRWLKVTASIIAWAVPIGGLIYLLLKG